MVRKAFHDVRVIVLLLLFISLPEANSQAGGGFVPRRLMLSQAENLLIERNLTVLAAKYQVDATRAARLIAAYKLNPVVTVGAEQIPFYSPIAGSYPRFAKTNSDAGANPVYTFRLDTTFERGGKRELRTAAAEAQLQASEAQMLDVVRTQLFQLRRAFTAATLARENLKLSEITEQQYAQTERLTLAKVDQGDIAKVEVYRAGAGRLQYQQAVLQARAAYDSAARDVLNLLGAHEQDIQLEIAQTSSLQPVALSGADPQMPESLRNAPLELIGGFDDRPVLQSLDELRSMALAERPDVAVARHLAASAESATALARAQQVRDVSVGYEYQRVGSDHSAGIVVSAPLFLNNNQRALAAQAEAAQRAAEAQLKQAQIQAATDVEKAYQLYVSARQVLDLYNTENLSQLEKLRAIANVSYREGASSLFELLDAQRAFGLAMTAYNQARADYQAALWGVEEAVGRSLR